MKIAILNISIGNYTVFWDEFYMSCEKNFITDAEKEYFVFTDKDDLEHRDSKNVHIIHQENMGWPFNTMKRYHLFSGIEDSLKDYDYIFFINGNALFVEPLTSKLLNPEKELITIQHPANYNIPIDKMPYERNPESNAYIAYGEGKYYVQGAFVGGRSKEFLHMSREIDRLTEEDILKNIIAIWHDESFLNMYVSKHDDFQILGRQYLYFEEYSFPYKPVILLRDKNKYMQVNTIRGLKKRRLHLGRLYVLSKNAVRKVLIRTNLIRWIPYIDEKGDYIGADITG